MSKINCEVESISKLNNTFEGYIATEHIPSHILKKLNVPASEEFVSVDGVFRVTEEHIIVEELYATYEESFESISEHVDCYDLEQDIESMLGDSYEIAEIWGKNETDYYESWREDK